MFCLIPYSSFSLYLIILDKRVAGRGLLSFGTILKLIATFFFS